MMTPGQAIVLFLVTALMYYGWFGLNSATAAWAAGFGSCALLLGGLDHVRERWK